MPAQNVASDVIPDLELAGSEVALGQSATRIDSGVPQR
jgi:hypothetical protein